MIVTVFRSRLSPDLREEYVALADRMNELARAMPGYISHKGFFADDGERVTIVEFESEETMRAWRMHPEHVAAQRAGRDKYYTAYSVQICEVIRFLAAHGAPLDEIDSRGKTPIFYANLLPIEKAVTLLQELVLQSGAQLKIVPRR